ncbi:MAG: photosystem II stability/assembly factor-like uncharacterized protein [Granulosicoccus sp.]|jgi:photosystem II stability/assembly factor-like uncharacterized protein
MKLFATVAVSLLSTVGFAQEWLDLIQQPNANFYDVRDSFENYWEETNGEGFGYKQYKRWEWFMENRVDEEGNLPKTKHLFTELAKVKMQREHRSGGAWELLGPIDVPTGDNGLIGIGRITALAFHPTDSMIMFAGAPSGGLWKTIDGGESWSTTTDHLPNLGVSDVVINPTNDSIMYMSTGDGSVSDTYSYGILKSTDAGETWDSTGLSFMVNQGVNISDLEMDPNNPDIIFAGTTNGIYRTEDAGETWIPEINGNIQDIHFMVGSSDILFASTSGGSGGRVYRSEDAGDSWELSGSGFPTGGVQRVRLAVTPADPNRIYALVSNNQQGFYGLYMSSDAGDTWELRSDSPNMLGYSPTGDTEGGQAWYCMDIAVSKVNPSEVAIGGINLWVSYNSGQDFTLKSHWTGGSASYIHADHHRYEYHPITNRFYVGSDGGIAKKAITWSGYELISNGISVTQFYRLSASNNNPDMVTGGAQDNGTKRMINGVWTKIYGGDGMETIISDDNDNLVFATVQGGAFFRSEDGGNSFSGNLAPEGGPWVTSYIQDPTNPDVFYCGTHRVHRSYNRASSWFPISPDLTGGGSSQIRDVKVSYSNPDLVFANTDKRLYQSDDFENWDNIAGSAPSNNISSFAIDPYDSDKVWLTYSGYTENRQVYRTIDGGTTWQNLSHNLPALPINCITIEKGSTGGVYIGTDIGVYYTDQTMDSWEPYMAGLPNVIVTELEIQDGFEKIVASTYGRGIWRSDTRNAINIGVSEDSEPNKELQIFPNPTNGEFKISCSDDIKSVQLLDAYGKLLQEFKPNGNFVVATSNGLPAGIYYLRATGDNGPLLERLIVSK